MRQDPRLAIAAKLCCEPTMCVRERERERVRARVAGRARERAGVGAGWVEEKGEAWVREGT